MTVGVRLSEPEAARLDLERGELDRSAWIRGLILAAFGDMPETPVTIALAAPRAERPRPARKIAATREASPPVIAAESPKRCTHAGKRIVGGYCKDCDHLIEPGGAWRA